MTIIPFDLIHEVQCDGPRGGVYTQCRRSVRILDILQPELDRLRAKGWRCMEDYDMCPTCVAKTKQHEADQ